MTVPGPLAEPDPAVAGPGPPAAEPDDGSRVSTLRGAGVDVDFRRVTRVVVALGLVTLAVVAAITFVAGFRKNAQITALRTDGVPVVITVTRCMGLLGGSGSNAAGNSCQGSFVLDGHRYVDQVPGYALLVPGSHLQGVTVRTDPALLSTVQALAGQHASWRVYLVPAVLVVVLALLVVVILVRRRRSPAVSDPDPPETPAR